MAMRSQRFGIRNPQGARSSEWIVMWKTNSSDVYLVTRTLGGTMKASLHASGRCHVRAPDIQHWRGQGEAPRFLDAWEIDVTSKFQFPFGVVVLEQELRHGDWVQYRDKGTVWLEAKLGSGIEVALFLMRVDGDLTSGLKAAGWEICLVDTALPDGRRLLVVAGQATVPPEKRAELDEAKLAARTIITNHTEPVGNPRMLLLAGANEQGTRKFVEAAVLQ